MTSKTYKIWWIVGVAALLGCLLLVPSAVARLSTYDQRYGSSQSEVSAVPYSETALILGAGILPDGTPTEYLKNRISTATDLYKAGKVDSMVMSGDNSSKSYDEPTVMRDYAVQLGVPASVIKLDYAGFSTYDSCYRAQSVFKLKKVAVVTQGYHLPRAVVTCQRLGIQTVGVAAKKKARDWTVSYLAREQVSTWKAVVQVALKPKPTVE